MPYELLRDKFNMLTSAQQQSVADYISFLIYKNSANKVEDKPKRMPGGLKGEFWMANDFDATPDCFKDYV